MWILNRAQKGLEWIHPRSGESEVAQWCPSLCDPMDCSLPGSSVHGIFQARVLEWVAIAFSRVSSWPRDGTWVSRIAGRLFTIWTTREPRSGTQMKKSANHWCWHLSEAFIPFGALSLILSDLILFYSSFTLIFSLVENSGVSLSCLYFFLIIEGVPMQNTVTIIELVFIVGIWFIPVKVGSGNRYT